MKTFRPIGTAFFLPAFLAAWIFLAPAASALRPDPSSQDAVRLPIPLQHAVTVTLKLVQVYVTDKQGKPVRDLAKEDFTVTDNGRIMALTEFEKHVLEAAFELPDYVLITDYETMFKELSAANCSIFSFDSREAAKVPTLFDYDEQTFGSRGSRDMFTQGGVQQNSNLVFKDENVTGLYSLSKLANATGGKYFGNINEYERNLDQLQNLTGSYYVLGYSIGEQWDGKFHEIKVEVKRKGCEARAQAGYFNPKPFAEYSDLEKQLHLFDLALSDRPLLQTPAVFAMGALSYASGEEPRLLMLSKIPTAVLDKFSGKKVEIVAIVFDDKDNVAGLLVRMTTGESIALPFTVLAKTGLGSTEIRFLEIPLAGVPSGKYRLYLHAEDAASHAVSYAQMVLTLTSDAPIR